jgi:hypothetical protein
MKMETFLNYRVSRLIIGTAIGIPATIISVILGFHGLILGYAGIKEADIYFLFMGIITITGFVGIIGAWCRLIISTHNTSNSVQNKIRTMLIYGLATSVALLIWSLFSDYKTLPIPLTLILAGTFFIYATPKKL